MSTFTLHNSADTTPPKASFAPNDHHRPDPSLARIEAHTSSGPTLFAQAEAGTGTADIPEHKSQYIFQRLKQIRPLPSPMLSWFMLGAVFIVMFLAGWNDASQGPLLPSLQAHYNVDYLTISIIWITNFVGFMTSGITNVYITDRIGFGLVAPFGATMQGLGYVLIFWGPPYPLFVIAYIFTGFGLGLQDAQVNSLVSRLPNANTKMFLLHAVYGLGATVSPLISTEFVKQVSDRTYLYFAVSLGLAFVTVITLIIVFQFRTEDQVVGLRKPDVVDFPTTPIEGSGDKKERSVETPQKEHPKNGSGGKMKRIMKTPAVHFMAFYIAIYVGIEVTIGGWATSFLLSDRNGDDNTGYVTTGYFAGIMIGRVILIPVTTWLGQHNAIYIYSIIAIALEIAVWTVPHLIGNAICYAFIGFVLGPMYPIVMMVCIQVMPGELHAGTIGWIASLGQAGSAIMPFITGSISNKYGPWILQPLIVAFLGFSLILWALVPRPKGKGWGV